MEQVWQLLNLYVSSLRALYLAHTNAHWLTSGPEFYANHLLFERLYKKAQEDADLAAEKAIGLFGPAAVDMGAQAKYLIKFLDKYQATDDFVELTLTMEKDFLAFSEQVYEQLKEAEVMTLGLDDMLMSIASSHEEACYLLQQAVEGL